MTGPRAGAREPASPNDLGDEIWVVLGGGGLKGLAHVGAWQALEEADVPVRGVVGTSIGALVGVCLAGGLGWDELVPLALELERSDIVRINRRAVWINGIKAESVFQGDVLRDYIREVVPVRSWDELAFPVVINAVDLESGESVWFGPGARTDVELVEAIYASAALPVLYPPARVDGLHLVDGGARDALPLYKARTRGASGIVAVDVGAGPRDDAEEIVDRGLVAIHERIYSIFSGLRRREAVEEWDGAPLLYVRPRLEGYSTFDFSSVKYFMEEGYRAARAALAEE